MSTKKKIGILVAILVILGVGKYVYDMNINHNFETITVVSGSPENWG